eukprot:304484_1
MHIIFCKGMCIFTCNPLVNVISTSFTTPQRRQMIQEPKRKHNAEWSAVCTQEYVQTRNDIIFEICVLSEYVQTANHITKGSWQSELNNTRNTSQDGNTSQTAMRKLCR